MSSWPPTPTTDKEVEVKVPRGSVTFPRSQVVKIVKKPSLEQEFKQRREALDAKNADGRISLATWCLERHFPRERAVGLAVEAFRIDPGNDGSIEMLTKLDFHYERDQWLEPEKWYPAHGHIRRDGRWITQEEAACRDAISVTGRFRDALGSASASVREAGAVVAAAPTAETQAKERLESAKADEAALVLKMANAKTALDSREGDLKSAIAKGITARRDLVRLQENPCPDDPNYRNLLANMNRVSKQAALDEEQARSDRDAALKDVEQLTAQQVNGTARVRDAQGALDGVHARLRTMTDDLPLREMAVAQARKALAQAEESERSARKTLEERTARDTAEGAERLKALRALRKKVKEDCRGPR